MSAGLAWSVNGHPCKLHRLSRCERRPTCLAQLAASCPASDMAGIDRGLIEL
jgi:hypothetical protein